MAEYVTKEQVIDWFSPYGHLDKPIPFETLVSDLRGMKSADVEPVVRCRECKHLNVLNRKELYAHCPKTNTVFLPFDLDTREHFCSLGERKDGDGNG